MLAKQGITLVDFKMEFGRQGKTIYLGDEISMDSMRLWDKKTGESLDKDVYRFNKGDVMATYNQVAARITKMPIAAAKKAVAAPKKSKKRAGNGQPAIPVFHHRTQNIRYQRKIHVTPKFGGLLWHRTPRMKRICSNGRRGSPARTDGYQSRRKTPAYRDPGACPEQG